MNKKGFTLIELLAILIILGAIAVISVVSINSINKQSTNNNELYNTIYMAAETYIYNNYENFRELDEKGSTSLINIIELINNDYLKNTITNPIDGEKFTSIDYIEVTRNENMSLSFEIVETFPPLIKINGNGIFTNDYTNREDEFLTVIFDKDGGTVECQNQLGLLPEVKLSNLPLGKNEITCVATATNGTTTSFTGTVILNGDFDYNTLYSGQGGYKQNNLIILPRNGVQYGPYYKTLKGCYKVEINGSNLDLTDNLFSYENISGTNYHLNLLSKTGTSDKIIYYINPDEDKITSGLEFHYRNMRDIQAVINNVTVTYQDSCPVE